jgi:hypothetical protein
MHDALEQLSRRLQKRSPIDVDGTPCAIWLIDIRDAQPDGLSVGVIVGAKSQSESHTGELHLGRKRRRP